MFVIIFYRDSYENISALVFEQLSALESVQEVTGYIQIQAHHIGFKNLSFLRNLKKIQGMTLIEYAFSLLKFYSAQKSLSTEFSAFNYVVLTTCYYMMSSIGESRLPSRSLTRILRVSILFL